MLEEDLDSDDIWDEWPEEESDVETRMAATDARNWLDDESEDGDLAEGWPMKE